MSRVLGLLGLTLGWAACRPTPTESGVDSRDTDTAAGPTDSGIDSGDTSDSDSASQLDTDDSTADSDSPPDTGPFVPFEGALDDLALTKLIETRYPKTWGGSDMFVAAAGDVDHDGTPDVIASWPGLDVSVFSGAVTGDVLFPDAIAQLVGPDHTANTGTSLASGDTNGDGFSDILIGAPYYSGRDGCAYLARGPVTGDVDLSGADAILEYEGGYQEVGSAVAMPDLDGDGDADIALGAHGQPYGYVYIVSSPVSGTVDLRTQADARISGLDTNPIGYALGSGVASAGDADGDGVEDLVIGTISATTVNRSVLFLGPIVGELLESDADGFITGGGAGAGVSPTSAGDVNADGYPDLLIGEPNFPSMPPLGAAYVVDGPAIGTHDLASASAMLVGVVEGGYAAGSLSSAGDFDGDGKSDVLIGAPYPADPGAESAGYAYILFGDLTGTILLSEADITLVGSEHSVAGFSVAGVGDIDLDGLDDVLIAGPGDSEGGTYAGAAWLVPGAIVRDH